MCPCAGPPVDVRPLAVLLAHPAVHAVACPLLYEGNVFTLDARGEHGPHVRRCLVEAAQAKRASNVGDDGGQDDQDEDDNDSDSRDERGGQRRRPQPLLPQRSALRRMKRIEVRLDRLRGWLEWQVVPLLSDMALTGGLDSLDVYVYRDDYSAAREVLTRPPMGSVPRVLGDPYLRRARLLWVTGNEEPAAAPREVEVDWRQMLHEADPDGRHRVVGLGLDVGD